MIRERTHRPTNADPERGFVLIGVIMLILALTILGLSLFSLSSYEAQFLGSSSRKSQAFYDALGGIERTKHILASDGRFASAGTNLPPFVVEASATQEGSVDTVDWDNPNPIVIEVLAQRGSERKKLRATYSHSRYRGLYRDAVAANRIFVPPDSAVNELGVTWHIKSVHVEGTVREQAQIGQYRSEFAGNQWTDDDTTPVPAPQVAEYLSHYHALGPHGVVVNESGRTIDLRTDNDDVYGLFHGPNIGFGPSTNDSFGLSMGFDDPMEILINAHGKVVIWLLSEGAHFNHRVRIRGSSSDRLIIVAGTSQATRYSAETGANLGLWFRGGIETNVPVFLISDGAIAIDREVDPHLDTFMSYASIFARGVYLRGPHGYQEDSDDPDFILQHDRSRDAEILFPLQDAGYLPNMIGGLGRLFTLVPGEFREVDDSD